MVRAASALGRLLFLVIFGCATGVGAPPEPDRPEPDAAVRADPVVSRAIAQALDRALAEGRRGGVVVGAECAEDGPLTEAQIFGSGVGIWNRTRQFRIPPDRVTALLERLRKVGFPQFQELYGTVKREVPIPGGGEGSALRVVCRVSLSIDGVTKRSSQLSKGPRSEALHALARWILDIAREPGATGVAAASLDAGLTELSRGGLAPEVLRVILHRKPDPRGVAAGETALLLRIEGGRATVQRSAGPDGYGDPEELHLAPGEIARLAGRLATNRLADLPVNLYAEVYTDLVVEVLGHEQQIQARPFSGMTPHTHGERQERFARVVAALAETAAREPEGSP